MAGKTLTRMDLSEAVFREVGLSRNESAQLVERVLELMSDELVEGGQVKISSFGTFSVREKTARVGRNPKTGVEGKIAPGKTVRFKPGKELKDL
jgi:integration host factor subunit alpha